MIMKRALKKIHTHALLVYACIFLDNFWEDVREDPNSGFSLGRGPVSLMVKEIKRLTFTVCSLNFFSWMHIVRNFNWLHERDLRNGDVSKQGVLFFLLNEVWDRLSGAGTTLLGTRTPSSSLLYHPEIVTCRRLTDDCYTSRPYPCVSGKKLEGQRAVPADYDSFKELFWKFVSANSAYILLAQN